MDQATRDRIEAAAWRKLVGHFQKRTDVQNIDLMNMAGFCRNCLSKWYAGAAQAEGLDVSYEDARTEVYGMTYAEWKEKYQAEATPEQLEKYKALTPDQITE